MTGHFSAEFAIRPFLLTDPESTLKTLAGWLNDPDPHVRRLVSEGTRPRLPWAAKLPMFIENPAPVLRLLDALKDDGAEYVRRSVANNLNDIAKDHPDVVADTARRWLKGASKNRARLVRHACRTLVKQGHPAALKALGYGKPQIRLERFAILTPEVVFGDSVRFEIGLRSTAKAEQALVVDYAVHHQKANGRTQAKVFKWKNVSLKAGESLNAVRKHALRPISTRVYYPGLHRVEVIINGETIAGGEFNLVKTER